MTRLLPLFTVATGALAPNWAWAQEPAGPFWYGMPMMWGWGGSGMIFGPIFMILALAAVIAIPVLLIRWFGGPWQGPSPHQLPPGRTPLDILRERYARGEIDKEEFEERRRVLGD